MGHFAQEGIYCLGKTLKRCPCQRTLDPNQVPTGLQLGFTGGKKRPKLTFYAVSLHGATYRPPNGIANMGGGKRWIDHHRTPQTARANICSLFGELGEDLPLANSADQAESR